MNDTLFTARRLLGFAMILSLMFSLLSVVSPAVAQPSASVTAALGSVTLSGGFQAENFPQVWDLTRGDLTLSFTYDATGMVDDFGGSAHAWAELGVRQEGSGNFNPNNKGIWLATDYDWSANTFDPDPAGAPNLDLDDKLILQKQSGNGEGAYNLPSVPPVPGNNHRFWFDRDGVDPYQAAAPLAVDGGTYNTGGTYEIVLTLHATNATNGTAFLSINGLDQGFETDGNWNTMELTPAGMTFTGDMTRMQVFYGLYGYSATHTAKFENISATGSPAPGVSVNVPPEVTCTGGTKTVTIDFAEIDNLYGYQFELNYPKDLVSAAASFDDTWLNTSTNASVPAGWDADCADGVCKFAVSKVDPGAAVSGSGTVATVTFTLNAPGTADLTISGDKLSDRDGGAIAHALSGGSFTICGWADVSGKVSLQGRATPKSAGTVTFTSADFSPAVVQSFDASTGAYTAKLKVMPAGSSYDFLAEHGLYLDNKMTKSLAPDDVYAAPDTKLKGGDADNSGLIDVSDLACIGGAFGGAPVACGTTGSSDINEDSTTNIFDLTLAGGNYNLVSPQAW